MSKDPIKSAIKTRRAELRRTLPRAPLDWRGFLRSPGMGWGIVIWGLFTILVGGIAVWTRERPLIAVGRVMQDTRTVRNAFEVVDEGATDRDRDKARQVAPRVYVADMVVLNAITASLESLPKALADAESVDRVDPGIRDQFGLTPEMLRAVQSQASGGEVNQSWAARVRTLNELLLRNPLIDTGTYQVELTAAPMQIELRVPGEPPKRLHKASLINVQGTQLEEQMAALVGRAGFGGSLQDLVISRLTLNPKPTFAFEPGLTAASQEEAAKAVPAQKITYTERQVIFRRGDILKSEQLELFKADINRSAHEGAWWKRVLASLGVMGVVGAVALAMAGYTMLFCPRIRRNPARTGAIAALLALTAALACVATAFQPGLIALTAIAPTVFVAVILAIAYDRRVALAYGALHGVLVCVALDQPVGMYALIVAGVGTAIWVLKEIRDRNALIRMGVADAVALAVGMFVLGLIELPITPESLRQSGWDAGLAGFGGLLVGSVVLFILPTIERVFDITTGLTLIELRDPKQPLLRQLQQRAPGTYNHSLNVASLAEPAAESIGADGLLTYVGALYHDIGKVNKPDYFVENQTPGFNKHDKLSPAMSLLIIVGHVKDGMELAREFGLPRSLHHFIEAHHGTTLVEYFFHRARKQASSDHSADAPAAPDEIEYRYPGPKPRSKEAAILMLCDAVESTARTMADPTPSRIDATVRAIATKRLMDGQFDESDLTLRELNIIVETVSKTLAAIYHGRIAYPSAISERPASRITPAPTPVPATTIQPGPPAAPATASGNGNGAERAAPSPQTRPSSIKQVGRSA